MRVLMLVANNVTRDPRVTREANTLAAHGHDVRVVGLAEDGQDTATPQRNLPYAIVLIGAHGLTRQRQRIDSLRSWPSSSSRVRRSIVKGAQALLRPVGRPVNAAMLLSAVERSFARADRHVAGWEPQVVHAHDFNTLRPALEVSRRRGVPLIYDAHELWAEMGAYLWPYRRWIRRREGAAIRAGRPRIITVSDSIADLLVKRYGVARPAVVVNAPEHTGVTPRHQRDSTGPPVFLYQGALTTGRGLETLIEAFQYVQVPCSLTIRGMGPLASWIRNRLGAGLGDRVTLEDPVPPAAVVEAAAATGDVGVIPFVTTSLNNRLGLPNKLFEYLAAGLAILSSDMDEVRRVIDRFGVGAVYRNGDPRVIARAVDTFASGEELRAKQERAHAAFCAELNWGSASRTLLDLYATL